MKPATRRTGAALALATAIAIPAEGLRQYAYYDPPGILTVCYGHTGKDVVKSRFYDLAECTAHLDADMMAAIRVVDGCAPGLPDRSLAAFADAVYNLGPRIVCDPATSQVARHLQAGRLSAACAQLPRWNKARVVGLSVELPGLTKRRATEQALCLEGAA